MHCNIQNNYLQKTNLMNMRVQNGFGIPFRYCFPHKTRLLESLARKTSRNPIKLHWDCVSNFSNWIWNFGIEKTKPYNNSPVLPNNTTVKKKLEIVIMMHILTSFFLKKSTFIQYWYPIFQFNISKYIQSFWYHFCAKS